MLLFIVLIRRRVELIKLCGCIILPDSTFIFFPPEIYGIYHVYCLTRTYLYHLFHMLLLVVGNMPGMTIFLILGPWL